MLLVACSVVWASTAAGGRPSPAGPPGTVWVTNQTLNTVAAYGLRGTARRLDDPAERARKAVTNRIRDALARIEAGQPALGRHLKASIRTGSFCSYQPERPVAWDVRPG